MMSKLMTRKLYNLNRTIGVKDNFMIIDDIS